MAMIVPSSTNVAAAICVDGTLKLLRRISYASVYRDNAPVRPNPRQAWSNTFTERAAQQHSPVDIHEWMVRGRGYSVASSP